MADEKTPTTDPAVVAAARDTFEEKFDAMPAEEQEEGLHDCTRVAGTLADGVALRNAADRMTARFKDGEAVVCVIGFIGKSENGEPPVCGWELYHGRPIHPRDLLTMIRGGIPVEMADRLVGVINRALEQSFGELLAELRETEPETTH